MPPDTAVSWLQSIAPVLARFKAEDAAIAALHSAHVDAWLDVPVCRHCAEIRPLLRGSMCRECRDVVDRMWGE